MRARSATAILMLLGAAACGRAGPGARNVEIGSFRSVGVGAHADPTVRPARLLPEVVDESGAYGSEPGGGIRAITAGLRVVTTAKGAIVAAEDRFAQPPQVDSLTKEPLVYALPERLGGGFLFVLGTSIWRSDRWLGPAKPIFTSPSPVQEMVPGLDRVYVRAHNGVIAIDGRSGDVLDLGPWPASPYVASYAAADGWRAAAVTDLRGVVATFDAGATWRALELPLEPKRVVASSDSLAIGGFENGHTESWYELRSDGSLARLGAPPREVKTKLAPTQPQRPTPTPYFTPGMPQPVPTPHAPPPPPPRSKGEAPSRTTTTVEVRPPEVPEKEDLAVKTFGKRPLATAIEDGWPLTDGTAVIARDGALGRVRLADGALIELVREAFPLKPARCHPVSLTRPNAVGAFGFVCGEPRGTTVIYAYEPLRGRIVELRRFDKPRVVTSSGNGALAVRGSCAEDADPPAPPRPTPAKLDREREKDAKESNRGTSKAKEEPPPEAPPVAPAPKPEMHPYCVLGHDNMWREIHVRGDVGGERVVVLADGRIVVVSPPLGLGTPARITVMANGGRATTAAITFPRVPSDVGRVLRYGVWLDGFEERRPGIVGGWLEAGGVMLGIEIALDGKATPGQINHDAAMPFVSGKYGFGWTAARHGYETTDGGMTWTSVDMPDPLVPAAKAERRACGPIGCLAGGWLRVGWGDPKRPPAPSPPPPYRSKTASYVVPQLQLACDPLAPMPAVSPGPKTKPPPPPPRTVVRGHFGSVSGPPVLGTFNGLTELPPFFSHPAPQLREAERGVNLDVRELVERFPNVGSLARIYGWGPKSGDWDPLGRWQVKWLSPFAGWPEVRSSMPSPPPQMILDMPKMPSSTAYYVTSTMNSFFFAPGDDAAHGLLVGRRLARPEALLFELEADRAPVEIRRADGEPFGEIEGVVRAAGRWFIATPPTHSSAPMTVIWQIDGSIARELVRVPRTTAEGHPSPSNSGRTRLARRSDGRALGLVVEGAPTVERSSSVRWVLPIDLESGAVSEPEPLGYADLAGVSLEACTDDVIGWVLDTPMPSSSVRVRVPTGSGSLSAVHARLRLTSARACIERLTGTYDGQSQERAAQLTRAGAPVRAASPPLRPGEMLVTAMSLQTRFPLKCSLASTR